MSGSFYQLNQKYNQLLALIQALPTTHNLTDVLTAGDDAGGLDITNLNDIALTTINGAAYPPVVADNTLTEVLTAGNAAGGLSITGVNDIALTTINSAAYPPVVADNTLTEVLTAGNAAGGLSITGVNDIALTTINSAAYPPVVPAGLKLTPSGSLVQFAGGVIPAGWLLCNGNPVSRITYADLFSVISTTYGAGDGFTTFNLPNMEGRVPVGVDTADPNFVSLNKKGGSSTITLTPTEMPSHTHTQNSHIHYIQNPLYLGLLGNTVGGMGAIVMRDNIGTTVADAGSWTATPTTATNQTTGGGLPHNNLQQYISLYYIIAT